MTFVVQSRQLCVWGRSSWPGSRNIVKNSQSLPFMSKRNMIENYNNERVSNLHIQYISATLHIRDTEEY